MNIKSLKNKMVPFKQLSQSCKVKLIIAYSLEALLSATGLALLIYYCTINDPSHRLWSSVGVIVAGLLPFLFEVIRQKRLSFSAHLVFFAHLTCSALFGGALMFHNTVFIYDKFMHFFLGVWSCAFLMLFMKTVDDLKPGIAAFILFMISMGFAAIWECVVEFVMNVFMGQTALGFLSPEAQEAIAAAGKTGVSANYMGLKYIGVWDTLMDMLCHLFGSLLFTILYVLNRKKGYNLGVGYFRDDYRNNLMNTPATEVAEVEISEDSIDTEAL